MHDYDTGLDMESFKVVADFAVDGIAGGPEPGGEVPVGRPGVLGVEAGEAAHECRRAS